MAKKEGKENAPPYVAFKTLWNFLDRLGEIGTPPRIDRSVWSDSLSGAYGSQLMAALRFLGLIDETGNADRELKIMAEDVGQRRQILELRLAEAYLPALGDDLDLSQATMAQLQDRFRETYAISGETFDKAISFFTHAAQAAGVKLSPYIERSMKKRTAAGKPKLQKRSRTKRGPSKQTKDDQAQSPFVGPDAHERIITLKSGGTVKLSLDYNAFRLSAVDRLFVFGLIDAVQEYESGGEA